MTGCLQVGRPLEHDDRDAARDDQLVDHPHQTRHLPQDPSRPADAGEHELPTQDHGMPAGRLGQRPLARPFGAGPRKSAIHPSIQTQRNGSHALSGPRLLSNPQAARMERLWSPAGATIGNRWQMRRPRNGSNKPKTVATGCDRLPIGAHGKRPPLPRNDGHLARDSREPGSELDRDVSQSRSSRARGG
jgi:hypothetical protein